MKLSALLLLASLLVVAIPAANANPVPPSYPPCVAGVTAASCYGGKDVCSAYASTQVPVCVDVPCYNPIDCIALGYYQCAELVSTGGVVVSCNVDGNTVTVPVGCRYCYPAFSVTCTEGTAGVGCYPSGIAILASNVKAYCIEGEQGCPSGELVCTLTAVKVCVPDPCYTTRCFSAPETTQVLL